MVDFSIGTSVVMVEVDGTMLDIYLVTTLRGRGLGHPCHQEPHEHDQYFLNFPGIKALMVCDDLSMVYESMQPIHKGSLLR